MDGQRGLLKSESMWIMGSLLLSMAAFGEALRSLDRAMMADGPDSDGLCATWRVPKWAWQKKRL